MKNKTYEVQGMSCGGCASTIEEALKNIKGVHSASVDLASKSVSIDFDEDVASENEFVEAIDATGYKLTL